jgi:hypothetical protein
MLKLRQERNYHYRLPQRCLEKAAEGRRSPKPGGSLETVRRARSVLECASPLAHWNAAMANPATGGLLRRKQEQRGGLRQDDRMFRMILPGLVFVY